jgi:hypothetical protein
MTAVSTATAGSRRDTVAPVLAMTVASPRPKTAPMTGRLGRPPRMACGAQGVEGVGEAGQQAQDDAQYGSCAAAVVGAAPETRGDDLVCRCNAHNTREDPTVLM